MGFLMIIGGFFGIVFICLLLSTLFWLLVFLYKAKKVKKYIPENIEEKIALEKNKEKEVENVRETRRNANKPELYKEQISEPRGREPDTKTGAETHSDDGDVEESGDVQLPSVIEDGESNPSDDGTERDIEEDWPDF